MEDIIVQYIDLPATVRSFVIANNDMTYTIVLNSKLSHEQNLISYQHELDHILRGDYEKKGDVDFLEINAHAEDKAKQLK